MTNKPETKIIINIGDDHLPWDRKRNIFRDFFTGKDNRTYDLGRALWAAAVVSYLALAFYEIYNGSTIDYFSYGGGLAGLLAGGGAAIGFKHQSEPDHRDKRRRYRVDDPDSENSGEGNVIP